MGCSCAKKLLKELEQNEYTFDQPFQNISQSLNINFMNKDDYFSNKNYNNKCGSMSERNIINYKKPDENEKSLKLIDTNSKNNKNKNGINEKEKQLEIKELEIEKKKYGNKRKRK